MALTLDGPRRKPAAGGAAKALIVLLHGYGADGNDLIELAGPLGQTLPHAAFVSPHAPERCDGAPFGYQWFSLFDRAPAEILAGADRAAPLLMAFVEAELAANHLDRTQLAFVGFSQGSMMSLHVGLALQPAPAAIVGFSGALIAPGRLTAGQTLAPVLLVHGEADPVVPFNRMTEAAKALRQVGQHPETLARPHLQHGIDQAGLEAAAAFLAKNLLVKTRV